MSIYTKQGDKGNTSLIGGTKVSKNHIRIEAYGTVDELNSHIGLLYDIIEIPDIKTELNKIQNHLFQIQTQLAIEPDKTKHIYDCSKLPNISNLEIKWLEKIIDEKDKHLPKMHSFIIPCGLKEASICHIIRTITRRAERRIIELAKESKIETHILSYINRLSDYFFVLARFLLISKNKQEMYWQVKK